MLLFQDCKQLCSYKLGFSWAHNFNSKCSGLQLAFLVDTQSRNLLLSQSLVNLPEVEREAVSSFVTQHLDKLWFKVLLAFLRTR